MLPATISLTEGKRVLFLTKDLSKLKAQLYDGLDLKMADLSVDELLDDINTDVMTPAWACFNHRPEDIAVHAYAGLIDARGERVFRDRALLDGNFEVIVSGYRKGTGSSRETAVQCEKWSGIRIAIAASFAPIHARNNLNLGQLMGDHEQLARLQRGEALPLADFTERFDPISRLVLAHGGLFPFLFALEEKRVELPGLTTEERPMTMAEKAIARHLLPGQGRWVRPGDPVLVQVDAGYSHEFTTAQVHTFLAEAFGADYAIVNPEKFAVFEDHLLYATTVAKMRPFAAKIQTLRELQVEFQRHTGCRDYSARDGRSPGICHQVAREDFIDPGDLVQATDSHTCMGGGSNALAWGVGATEYAGLVKSGIGFVQVPESIRFELSGSLREGVTAKDVILYILEEYAARDVTLDRVIEFGGPGLESLDMDERATLTNMATECSAKTGICEADELSWRWLRARRPDVSEERWQQLRARAIVPDPDAVYTGGVHRIDLDQITPRVAEPGDPTYGKQIAQLGKVPIDIAYAGSCTAGKERDFDFYARVLREAVQGGRRVAENVRLYVQFGSERVERYAREQGYLEIFEQAGAQVIHPGCGACIGCGPGVSDDREQVTVSAINRNFPGRSGPGKLYLASPLTVAASAVAGHIVAYEPGMFGA